MVRLLRISSINLHARSLAARGSISREMVGMVEIGQLFNHNGTWYRVRDIIGETVITIEDPDRNRAPNIRDYVDWNVEQVDKL